MNSKSIVLVATLGVAVCTTLFLLQSKRLPAGATTHAPGTPLSESSTGTSPSKTVSQQKVNGNVVINGFYWAAITAFGDWSKRWQEATPEERELLKVEGERLARERRPEFKKLIVADPERALEQAVRPVIRQTLPAEIVRHLEKPVSARGDLNVYRGRPGEGVVMEGSQLVLRYFETAEGESYFARVFGTVQAVMSRRDVPVRGVAVDRELALADSAVRVLEAGEWIPAGTPIDETCPVSGNTTPVQTVEVETVSDVTPTIEVANRLIRLCDGSHVRVVDDWYRLTDGISANGGPGGAHPIRDAFPGTSSEAIGNFKALYIRACYPDRLVAPNTEESAYDDMKNFARFYVENSYGRLSVSTVVTPLVVLPHTRQWYEAKDSEVDGLGLVHSDSRRAARLLGFDSGQFNVTIVRINGGPRLNGISWGGGDSVWVSWDGMDVINHECGHSIGRPHANYWDTGGKSAIGPGANQEYGNSFDVMGGGGGFSAHYNTISKRSLGWLPTWNTHNPTVGGVYRVFAYDQPTLEEGKRYGLRIAKDRTRGYNLEYHRSHGAENTSRAELTNSALVIWSGFGGAGHLVDTTPGTSSGKEDAGIELGRTFSDPGAGLHFTVLSRNASSPPSLDIALVLGNDPTNLAPSVSLSASATNVALNGTLTFTATATDPNGDALAYHWDFGDGYPSENGAVLTRRFTTARQHTVQCSVSDQKGGVTRRHLVVTVGSPGRQVLAGRVTTAGGQPVQGVLLRGAVSTTTRYAYTDTDGFYHVSDLPTGTASVTPLLYGNGFSPSTGTVAVVAGANTLDFTAEPLAEVSLTVLTNAAEPSTQGAFRLARTGSTSNALTVRVMSASGTAARGTDYAFTPDYVDDGNYRTFTIPADAPWLDIAVVPINDGAAEGPESVVLQLAEGDGYIPGVAGVATLSLEDEDTTLPQVRLVSADTEASESPGNTASFEISRTGPASANLSVSLTYAGTATRGTDYPPLPLVVTLPAGQSTATVLVAPVDDSLTEGSERLQVGLAASAAYVRDVSATNVDLLVLDDDIATVTIAAIDAAASEAGRDPGVFLISRTGSTAAPLKVYYGVSGTASHGTDYTALPAEVTLPAGAASAPVVISPYDDEHGEGVETVTLQLTVFDGAYLVGAASSATVQLSDNNDPGLLTVDSTSSTAGEPTDAGRFRFSLRGSRTNATLVRYTLSGTATPGSDFTALPGTLSLPATVNGLTEVDLDLTPLDDLLKEDLEVVTLTITPDPAYVIYNSGSAVVMIRDNDQPTVSVSLAQDMPVEGVANNAGFYLGRTDATITPITTGDLVVNYILGGTAANGLDYTNLSGTVTIPDGASGVDLPIDPINDTLPEGTETIILTVAPSPDYSIGVASDFLTLGDNETNAVLVRFQAASGSTPEGPDPVLGAYRHIPVLLSAASTNPVTVEVVMAAGTTAWGEGIDWGFVDETNGFLARALLTFPPGVTSQNARLYVNPDNLVEGTEAAVLMLTNSTLSRIASSNVTHVLSIVDNTNAYPAVRALFLTASSTVGEADASNPLLLVGLDRASPVPVTVNYAATGGTAASGADYTLAAGLLTFAPGEISKPIPLAILNDTLVESAETVVVTLSAPAGADLGPNPSHTVTINDNDTGLPAVIVMASTPTAIEGGAAGAFTINRISGGAAGALTVRYYVGGSATPGADYSALPGQVTLPSGQASIVVPVTPLNDTALEPAETVTLTLLPDSAYVTGAESVAEVVIADDEAAAVPPTAFPQSLMVTRNQSLPLTLTAADPNGDPLTYQIVTSPAQGTLSGTAPNLTYTPATNYVGSDSFTFRATDGATTSAVATVSLQVYNPVFIASNSVWRYHDAGVDLGTAWRTNDYVDAGWSNGAARLGFGDTQATLLRGQPVNTYYFRQSFVVPSGVSFTGLTVRVARDDGVVVYLNGTEVVRDNMPAGTITYSTLASANAANELALSPFTVSPGLLRPGTNLLAAEVHQVNATSSDAGFALELVGGGVPSVGLPPTVVLGPADPDAGEPSDPGAFIVARVGGSLASELIVPYVLSGSAIPGYDYAAPAGVITIPAGQSNAVVTITPLDDADIEPAETIMLTLAPGTGYNLESNLTATVILSDDDALRVPPTAMAQAVSLPVNTAKAITLVATNAGTGLLTYEIVSAPQRGTLSGTPPFVTYTPQAGYVGADAFTFRASDGGPWSDPATVSLTVYDPAILIATNSLWRYHDLGQDLGTAWRGTNYNDAGWSNGFARLGFGDTQATLLRGQPVITYYFRQTFVVPANYTVTNAVVSVARDDGVVLYLNGTEIVRDNMPAGTIGYSTYASANAADEVALYPFTVNPPLFRPGTNVLAAEVHQVNSTSSDAGFNLGLRADGYFTVVTPPTPPLLSLDRPSATTVRVAFPSANGVRWAVEGSSNLLSWTSLATNTTAGGVFQYTTASTNSPLRFFRARWVP
ncbi:MAG: hypothetical protein RJA22_2020 [Verrucomicrobiota bacterium]